MMQFAYPHLLWLLLIVPVIGAWWAWGRRARPATMRYSSVALLEPLQKTVRQRLAWLPRAIRLVVLALVIMALARPQEGFGEVQTKAKGVAMTFVVDRSWSMIQEIRAGDGTTTRIDAVKQLFRDFVLGDGHDLKGRPEDMIGLVTFARFADTLCPLTRSHETLVKLVDSIELARPNQLEGGTAIGDGLALAIARLKRADDELKRQNEGKVDPDFVIKSKAIVLMSDGAENIGERRAVDVAQVAKEAGIKVYCIGIGGGIAQSVQTPFGVQEMGPQYAYDGRTLRSVAQISGGTYREAKDADSLREIYAEIDKLEKTEIESTTFTTYSEVFTPWALAAGMGLLAEVLLGALVFRRSP
ncbi:MAG TPA: VWA domain-containing protein [Phycisphaerales bacterium]|nr:VWA domain-containing protein [Phycisphaerales bacterium]